MSVSERPAHFGSNFAPPLHTHAEGPTDPSNTKLSDTFVVAVLGASRGIGAATATAYAKAGVRNLMLSARDETSLHGTAKAILSVNPRAKVICQSCDLTKAVEVKELAEATTTAFGRLDVCIVAAGVVANNITDPETGKKRWPVGVVEGEPEDFSRVLDTNITGTYNAAKYMVPLLERTKDGPQTFIGVSSAAAHQSATTCKFCHMHKSQHLHLPSTKANVEDKDCVGCLLTLIQRRSDELQSLKTGSIATGRANSRISQ